MIRRLSLFLLLCCLPLFTFCEKPDIIIEDTLSKEARPAFEQFNDLARSGNVDDVFLFFTDPHLLGSGNKFSINEQNRLIGSFDVAKELYDTLKLDFCLCGGDWLNSGDTQAMAKEKLLFADQQMKDKFSRYYKMLGNHDTNYQGIISIEDPKRGDFPRSFVDEVYFSETGSAFYSFLGKETQFFVLDSDLDWSLAMDDYRWEQLHWLADELTKTENEHLVLCIHMFYCQGKITPMSELLVQLIDNYNSCETITLNGKQYDYTSAKGKIHCVISGHSHYDSLDYEGADKNIPIIRTCNYTINGTHTFDLCVMDYERGVLNLIRVGEGESREIII